MFGTYNRFTPEALGMLMSSAMAWMVLEVGTMLLSLYILAVSTGNSTIVHFVLFIMHIYNTLHAYPFS